jgi:hypothetical protein
LRFLPSKKAQFVTVKGINRMMKIQQRTLILITLVLITACGIESGPAIKPDVPDASTEIQENNGPLIETLVPTETLTPIEATASPAEAAGPNCLGDEVSPVGQSIAEDYEFTSYEQVMTWFCNGAEFEDILVALETESQTGTPAEELLQMAADGLTWDEIWQMIGLTP